MLWKEASKVSYRHFVDSCSVALRCLPRYWLTAKWTQLGASGKVHPRQVQSG